MAYAGTVSATPHIEYSSSVGVLGCKINIDLVAYWPKPVDCDSLCVKLTTDKGSLNVLHIDQSSTAYDISYNAWNYLMSGKFATESPQLGGGVLMDYEYVPTKECLHILHDDGLPLSATNSMNFLTTCLSDPNSWVSQNYRLFNINDPRCEWGIDEECELDLHLTNQPFCPSLPGSPIKLDLAVHDIAYGTSVRGNT